jgi:hypothetical protein
MHWSAVAVSETHLYLFGIVNGEYIIATVDKASSYNKQMCDSMRVRKIYSSVSEIDSGYLGSIPTNWVLSKLLTVNDIIMRIGVFVN